MDTKIKTELISTGYTFLSTFIIAVGSSLSVAGTIEWTTAFWVSIALAALRSAIKTLVNGFVPTSLGGRKGV